MAIFGTAFTAPLLLEVRPRRGVSLRSVVGGSVGTRGVTFEISGSIADVREASSLLLSVSYPSPKLSLTSLLNTFDQLLLLCFKYL